MTELEAIVRQLFVDFDAKNFDTILRLFSHDIQGVDEITRKWMRGRMAADAYFKQVGPLLTNVHTELSDFKSDAYGETYDDDFLNFGVATCWMEQDYTLEGKKAHVAGPVTVIARREEGAWRVVLLHAVPLPDAPAT